MTLVEHFDKPLDPHETRRELQELQQRCADMARQLEDDLQRIKKLECAIFPDSAAQKIKTP